VFVDEEGISLVGELFKLPARKKHPRYYQVIQQPIDLYMINTKIPSGEYTSVDMFEKDILLLISNVEVWMVAFFSPDSDQGGKVVSLSKKLYPPSRRTGWFQDQIVTYLLPGMPLACRTATKVLHFCLSLAIFSIVPQE